MKKDLLTRRSFLRQSVAAVGGLTVVAATETSLAQNGPSFLELLRVPDRVTVYASFERTLPTGGITLQATGARWGGGGVAVESTVQENALVLTLAAPSTKIAVVHVRWQAQVTSGLRALGDAWERSYGDLGWRNLIPERVMPWYFATHDGATCHGYGVKTDAAALCFWQLDPQGVSLWLNVTNGGDGVELGQRRLTMATVVTRRGVQGENAQDAVGWAVPVHVRAPFAADRAHLRRERLVLQLRAKHCGDNPARHGVHRRALAQRGHASLLGGRRRVEQWYGCVAGHGQAGPRNQATYGAARDLDPAARSAAGGCTWLAVAGRALWREAGPGA